jgi:hypothetical protein
MDNGWYRRLPGLMACIITVCPLSSIAENQNSSSVIQVVKEADFNPWSNLEFPDANSNFQFAIVSDNTGGAYPGVFEAAMHKINLMQPEFVMSIGDLIEGYSNREQVVREWEEIDSYISTLNMPFFYIVGNHDVGDEVSRRVWQERLGRSYYHFVYKDTLFLCLNSEDPPQDTPDWLLREILQIQSLAEDDPRQADIQGQVLQEKVRATFVNGEAYAPAISDEQVSYFKDVLAKNTEVKWTFLFIHRPAWQAAEQNRSFTMLEEALAGRPYTVFAGHGHTYKYDQRNSMDYLRLSTTGGTWVLEPPGNFDHMVWVTMTDKGPVIANITLDGIFGKTGKRKPVRDVF